MALNIDVISDVICPWCFVGKRRLEAALRARDGATAARVRWLPFQLNPQMPRGGMARREYRTAKFGSWERSQALDERLRAVGASEGIAFAFDRIERTPNTLDAHRTIWLAGREGVQDAVVEALFRAYFTEGRDIGDRQTLLEVASEAGLDRGDVAGVLGGVEGLEEIRATEEMGRRAGVQGVPCFLINGEVALSGAQPAGTFLEAFDRLSPTGAPPGS